MEDCLTDGRMVCWKFAAHVVTVKGQKPRSTALPVSILQSADEVQIGWGSCGDLQSLRREWAP